VCGGVTTGTTTKDSGMPGMGPIQVPTITGICSSGTATPIVNNSEGIPGYTCVGSGGGTTANCLLAYMVF
jgi:hypothetical protein